MKVNNNKHLEQQMVGLKIGKRYPKIKIYRIRREQVNEKQLADAIKHHWNSDGKEQTHT